MSRYYLDGLRDAPTATRLKAPGMQSKAAPISPMEEARWAFDAFRRAMDRLVDQPEDRAYTEAAKSRWREFRAKEYLARRAHERALAARRGRPAGGINRPRTRPVVTAPVAPRTEEG